ncbi:SCO3242 family prenyltransferase [Streptomyces radicis]|uniref:SCO3242 family prenyltransferase n=1 Tax=Streptomyces radicis TaxID=1750517 RepID=UPI001E490FBC|nr:UbiA family prenyltransferase [Streptomyces radicis]
MSPTARAWVELLRGPAALTVPGDIIAGAVTAGGAPPRRIAMAAGASVCLYWSGMALNDWADRELDAVERPERPLPSGRIPPRAAFGAAAALTAAGLGLAAACGRTAATTATAVAATAWAYNLGLKNTPAGPAAMATARSLNVLLGAATSGDTPPTALRRSALAAAHTFTLTTVSRHEVGGAPRAVPLAAAAATTTIAAALLLPRRREREARSASGSGLTTAASARKRALPRNASRRKAGSPSRALRLGGGTPPSDGLPAVAARALSRAWPESAPGGGRSAVAAHRRGAAVASARRSTCPEGTLRDAPGAVSPVGAPARSLRVTWPEAICAVAYAATALPPLVRAVREPTGGRMRQGVVGGLNAMLPLQAALVARAGGGLAAPALLATLLAAKRLSRKVTPT